MTPPRSRPGSGLLPDPGGHPPKGHSVGTLAHELKASYAFVERNFFLTRRYWGWEIAFLVYSVAGALSISLIGAAAGDDRLLLTLIIGAIFWNYLSVVFSLDRRDDRRRALGGHARVHVHGARSGAGPSSWGRASYAMVYGLVHTAAILIVLVLVLPRSSTSPARTSRPPRCSCCWARSASWASA